MNYLLTLVGTLYLIWLAVVGMVFVVVRVSKDTHGVFFEPRDGWVGFYYSPKSRRLYFMPIPFVGFFLQWEKEKDEDMELVEMSERMWKLPSEHRSSFHAGYDLRKEQEERR